MTAVRTWTGREAAALRAALRLSIRDFAELLGVGVRTVTKWQSRGRDMCLRPATQALLDTALRRATDEQQARFALLADTPQASSSDRTLNSSAPQGADLDGLPGKPPSLPAVWDSHQNERLVSFLAGPGAGIDRLEPDSALRLSHEWRIADPPQLTHLRSGRHIGKRLACLVIERTDALRRMDDFLGGEDLHRLVRRELDVTVAMMREASYTESTGQQLLGAVGELCQLAGWVASDAGMTDLAERYYLGGVAAAHAAGNRPLAANLLSSLSYQMSLLHRDVVAGQPRN